MISEIIINCNTPPFEKIVRSALRFTDYERWEIDQIVKGCSGYVDADGVTVEEHFKDYFMKFGLEVELVGYSGYNSSINSMKVLGDSKKLVMFKLRYL